jgi:hypothetical protein
MNIHYKIVELWPNDHLIVARYWTDNITEEMLASDPNRKEDGTPVRCRTDVSIGLPVPTPSTDEVDVMVKKNVPLAWLKMLEAKLDPQIDTEVDHIYSLLNAVKTTDEETVMSSSVVEPPELIGEDIQKLIDRLKN